MLELLFWLLGIPCGLWLLCCAFIMVYVILFRWDEKEVLHILWLLPFLPAVLAFDKLKESFTSIKRNKNN